MGQEAAFKESFLAVTEVIRRLPLCRRLRQAEGVRWLRAQLKETLKSGKRDACYDSEEEV